MSRYISETVRAIVSERDRVRCRHCSKQLCFNNRQRGLRGAWHCDHNVPFAYGGSRETKQSLCRVHRL